MMEKETLLIISVKEIAKDTIEMVLQNAYIAKNAVPGQFLHIRVEGHTLRRPISIACIDRDHLLVTILFKMVGDGTKQLAHYKKGMTIDAIGPSGNGFSWEGLSMKTALLVGGGIGVPPLYFLGRELAQQGIDVLSVLGFQSKEQIFYEANFKDLGKNFIVTNDGSYGAKGFVTNGLDMIGNFDYYFSCGPVPMLAAVTKKLASHQGFISLEERMGCGVGTCFACVIATDNEGGYKKICKDGPVFQTDEVIL